MSYKVKLQIFQGPMDLLLFLIKKEKIDIYDIPIVLITQQYLEYLELMKILDLEIAGEFLVMAATLIHIKSKMLLPQDEEEEVEEEDPRDDLVRRLLEYKKFKEASEQLQDMYYRQKNVFLRSGSAESAKIVLEDGMEYFEASLFDLITAFRKVLKGVSKEVFHKVIRNKFSVSDKIHEIFHLLKNEPKIPFSNLFGEAFDKNEIITTFMAVLELVKMREIIIVQEDFFSDIEIIRNPELTVNRVQSFIEGE